jgi:hypothetical protein
MRMKASISSARPVKFAKLSSSWQRIPACCFATRIYEEERQAGRDACASSSASPEHSRDQPQVTPAELAADDQRDYVGD